MGESVSSKSDNSPRKDEIAADAEREIGKTVEEWFATGEFDLHARVRGILKQALTSYEEERTPPAAEVEQACIDAANLAQSEARRWELSSPKTSQHWDAVAIGLKSTALVIGALRDQVEAQRIPSGEGWQQRIAAMDPFVPDTSLPGMFSCFFCTRLYGRPQPHADTCLWQNAKDATPPVSRGEGK